MTNSVHQDKFYRDTRITQTAPTRTAKTRAMLRLLRPQTTRTPMTGHYPPASMHSATFTHFIAGPLGVIAGRQDSLTG
jgi:hypothetical protein